MSERRCLSDERTAAIDWRPNATRATLQARADLYRRLRDFFMARAVLEVETPLLCSATVTDPALASLVVGGVESGQSGYLQTSPEFPMKRLLAAGSGAIYQICKVFRDDERGRFHHPEFTLLEWYRPGWDYLTLMDEVAELVRVALQRPALPLERIAYRELFRRELDVDPWSASVAELRAAALAAGIAAAELALDADGWLALLLTHCLESRLGRGSMTFLYDYPPSQAALARIRQGAFPVAERFELYLEGVELANGFSELTNAVEQRARFDADLQTRQQRGQTEPPRDERLLAALTSGLPDCAGVALGLDRLLMIALGIDRIDDVLAFASARA